MGLVYRSKRRPTPQASKTTLTICLRCPGPGAAAAFGLKAAGFDLFPTVRIFLDRFLILPIYCFCSVLRLASCEAFSFPTQFLGATYVLSSSSLPLGRHTR